MISTSTVVFDSNVLFSIRLTSLLMELAMSGLFRARWSADIHREWMAAVSKARDIPVEALSARRDYMDEAVPDGCVEGYEPLIDGLTLPDPNDRHVLAAAIRCGASAIVTFNGSDFPADVLTPFGIHIRNPDDFIMEVDAVDSGTLIEAAKADLEHYQNPPLSPDEYIEGLKACGLKEVAEYLQTMKVLLTE
jgi:predicted nucleic acid-binding protein